MRGSAGHSIGQASARPVSHSPGVGPAASVVREDPLGRERYKTLRLPRSLTPGELPLQGVDATAPQWPPEFRRGQDGGFSTKVITTTGHPGEEEPGAMGWAEKMLLCF